MILQSLYDYYQRKAAIDTSLPPIGWDWVEIPWLALFSETGDFFDFQSTAEGEGKERRHKPFLVPVLGEKKGAGIKSNLLWENIEYMFGIPVPTAAKPNPDSGRVKVQHQEFLSKLMSVKARFQALQGIQKFFAAGDFSSIKANKQWSAVLKSNRPIILGVVGVGPLTNNAEVRDAIDSQSLSTTSAGICLVTGELGDIKDLEPPIKGVRGEDAKAERAFVSFNLPAFCSYGKQQNINAPISGRAYDAYAKALNHMMGRNSRNKVSIGDSTAIFWAEKHDAFEESFPLFFNNKTDDPDCDTLAVRNLYKSIETGEAISNSGTRFFVLGLAPNAARISVRFWHVGTITELSDRIRQHFNDLEIKRSTNDTGKVSLFWHLRDIATERQIDHVPPNLASDITRAILEGTPYPALLLHQTIRRIRAEQVRKDDRKENVTRIRASLLKAYLNRFHRIHPSEEKEILVALDPANMNPGYLLGRLFAVLEKIQEDAQPGINATIRDRFYGAASASPVTVFSRLIGGAQHHRSKLKTEKPGLERILDRWVQEVMSGLPPEMPSHLRIEDQARFAIGYYHQRQALFAKSDKSTSET